MSSSSEPELVPLSRKRKTPDSKKKRRKVNLTPAVMRITIEQATEYYTKKLDESKKNDWGLPDEPQLTCYEVHTNVQNGYPVYSYSHSEANLQISHLALRVTKGDAEVPYYKSKRETASHLCHNKKCIRASHIIKEKIGANGRRNGCLAFVACGDCDKRINACGHHPHCILPFAYANSE
jgi:Zinc-binding loop region of homing endonuclease